MGYFGMFTKLASLRGDALLSSPTASLAQHARILLLLGGILVQAASYIATSADSMGAGSARQAAAAAAESACTCRLWLPGTLPTLFSKDLSKSAMHCSTYIACRRLLLLFDAAYVAVDAALSVCKYAVHAADHYQALQAEARGQVLTRLVLPLTAGPSAVELAAYDRTGRHSTQLSPPYCPPAPWPPILLCCSQAQEREPWEGRSELIYWLDLASDLVLQTLTLAHHLHLW